MIRKLLLGAGVTLGLLAALAGVQLASAHSRPIRFDPPPGTVLSAAPSQVNGWFTAEIRRDPNWSFIHVTDGQGTRVDTGETALSADRREMTATLRAGLGPGRYVVTWRTFDDADGAIFGDCYTFFVGQAAADAAVGDKYRLDAGRDCQRIDVSARNGTPVAGGTPQATPVPEDDHTDEDEHAVGEPESGDDDGGGDIPVWGLVLGIAAGVVAGGIGGRYLGSRS